RDTRTPTFIATLLTITKLWKEPKCPSMDEWIKKMWFGAPGWLSRLSMWFMYTMECYLAMKKNEILPFATMWMELECITPRETNHAEKDRYHMISLPCAI
ncbi:LORF2 protein, partial [Crocuta crocuta]